jgi:serine/threonine protein kinase
METGALIGRGATAEIYRLDGGGVLKLFRSYIPPALSEREYSSTRIVAGCGIRAPEASEYTEHEGRYGIVFEYVRGRAMTALMMNPFAFRKYARLLAALQYGIHQNTPEGLPSYKALLAGSIELAPHLDDNEKQQVLALLSALPDGNAVCHGDFHPENIMITEDGPVIMDWMTCGSGDPAADVARTMLMLSLSELPDGSPWLARLLLGAVRGSIVKVYFREYALLSHIAPDDIKKWLVPHAAARLLERRPARETKRLYKMVVQALNPQQKAEKTYS